MITAAAMAGVLLSAARCPAAIFTAGPAVRVTANTQVEFKWITDVTWFGEVAVYDNPDGTGAPVAGETR
jgi:hypothetical protein